MRKKIITTGCLMLCWMGFSQVGIGTNMPHDSALLELRNKDGDHRGVLIPRVALKSLTDISGIKNGDIATSLIVFNTTSDGVLYAGFYYWNGRQWLRIVNEQDLNQSIDNFPINETLEVKGKDLVLQDTKSNSVSVPIAELNILTTLHEIENGKFEYTNELGKKTLIDIEASVVETIKKILNDNEFTNELYNTIAAKGKTMGASDGSIMIVDGEKAVLNPMELSVAPKGITVDKIAPGQDNQFLTTNAQGQVEWLTVDSSIIKDIVYNSETETFLQDLGDGTLRYFNERDIDAQGNVVGQGVVFDANTLVIKEQANGVYKFYDKSHINPIAIIDIVESVQQEITEILNNVNVSQEIFENVAAQGKQVSSDSAIHISTGEKAVLHPMKISLNDQGVSSSKIKDGAVTAQKLFAGTNKENYVGVVQSDGGIKYEPVNVLFDTQTKPLLVDQSLAITGDATNALLQQVQLSVNKSGISNIHLAQNTITSDKLNSKGALFGSVLTASSGDGVVFTTAENFIAPSMKADLVSDDHSIHITGGQNVLFGDSQTKVNISIDTEGVKSEHLGTNSVINEKIDFKTIEASKLNAGVGVTNRVALANAKGDVSYSPLTSSMLKSKGNIKTDGIISVDNGKEKVFADVLLGVNDNSITSEKLNAAEAVKGAVLTVVDQNKVAYIPINANTIANAGDLTLGKAFKPLENNGVGSVLSDVEITIQEGGIGTHEIGNGAVTVAKLSSEQQGSGRVLVSADQGKVVWGELSSIVDLTAGNLTTDGIIQINGATGEKALLHDAELGIKENSITRNLLSSIDKDEVIDRDYILVTDGVGGFDYVTKGAFEAGGEDLSLEESLEFLDENKGLNVVLAPTKIGIKNQGINTDKLADGAVTTQKISSENALENAVLIADGNKGVSYKELNANSFAGQGKALLSDASIVVTKGDKALLEQTTIALAKQGVHNEHLGELSVTSVNISSKNKDVNSQSGTVLASDGNGNTSFISLEDLSQLQGHQIKSSDGSLILTQNNRAVLQDLTINIAEKGVLENHIGDKQVSVQKIGSDKSLKGSVLASDGDGGADFISLKQQILPLTESIFQGEGIEVSGGKNAVLQDVTISVIDKGISTEKLAQRAVTVEKIGAKGEDKGLVLTAQSDGSVAFLPSPGQGFSKGKLSGDATISVDNGNDAALKDTKISLNRNSVSIEYLQKESVGNAQIINKSVNQDKISSGKAKKNELLLSDGNGGAFWGLSGEMSPEFVALPKIFYLPAMYVEVVSGVNASVDLYDYYKDQFNVPKASNPGAKKGDYALPVYPKQDLNYYVTYYDSSVFYDVEVDDNGTMSYKIKVGAEPTGRTFFNVVLQVR